MQPRCGWKRKTAYLSPRMNSWGYTKGNRAAVIDKNKKWKRIFC